MNVMKKLVFNGWGQLLMFTLLLHLRAWGGVSPEAGANPQAGTGSQADSRLRAHA
jgi:hypothetical protein